MTKNAKVIIGVVSGVVLMGGFLLIAAVVGLVYFAAQAESAKTNPNVETDKPAIQREQKPEEKKLSKPADIDGLIKFHEWASETKFSDARRKRFEAFVERDFQNDAEKARKDTDELIAAHEKIRREDKNVQEFTRAMLAPALTEDFRKKTDDYSKFMLAVYEKQAE